MNPYWPNSSAMNDVEIDRFEARVALFTGKQGLAADPADRVADQLVLRDREQDERRMCVECRHLSRTGRRLTCENHKVARAAGDLSTDWVVHLQRCPGFAMRRRPTK